MDIPRLIAMKDYWAVNPPLHLMVKAYLGYGKEDKPEEQGSIEDLMAFAPQTPGSMS